MSNGLPWSKTDDDVLVAGVLTRSSNKLLARQLARSVNAVEARISILRKLQRIPPTRPGRRNRPTQTLYFGAPPEMWARADLAQAIATLGRLLPMGMRVTIYHPDGEQRAAIETTYPDGETTRHWVDQAMN